MSIKRHKEPLSYKNMDYYYPLMLKRKVINRITRDYFRNQSVLDIGCGEMPYKSILTNHSCEYRGVDIENPDYQKTVVPDLFWDGKNLPVKDNSQENILLIEVLEHIPDPLSVLKEAHRTLKSDGLILITVPFVWNLHDAPYDYYRYTPFAIRKLMDTSGFQIIELSSFGGWNSSLGTMLALYSRRALKGKKHQKLISKLVFPFVKRLYKKDENIAFNSFNSGFMPTGLWCLAKKIKI